MINVVPNPELSMNPGQAVRPSCFCNALAASKQYTERLERTVNLYNQSRIAKFIAVIFVLGLPTAALATSGSFEMDIPIANVAAIEVTNGSGTVNVRGADVDQVTIRARISVDERYAKRDPYKSISMVESLKRSPPIRTDGDRSVIEQPRKHTQRRHV